MTNQLTAEQLFCLEGCGSYKQYHTMRTGFEAGKCVFCELNPVLNKIILEDEFTACWAVHPDFLRKELAHHFIIIPKREVRFPTELTEAEVVSMHSIQIILFSTYDLQGGIIATRFGDMRLNAGTVPHLHVNIMVPNGTGEVRIPVFKDPGDRDKNVARAAGFALRFEACEQP